MQAPFCHINVGRSVFLFLLPRERQQLDLLMTAACLLRLAVTLICARVVITSSEIVMLRVFPLGDYSPTTPDGALFQTLEVVT